MCVSIPLSHPLPPTLTYQADVVIATYRWIRGCSIATFHLLLTVIGLLLWRQKLTEVRTPPTPSPRSRLWDDTLSGEYIHVHVWIERGERERERKRVGRVEREERENVFPSK